MEKLTAEEVNILKDISLKLQLFHNDVMKRRAITSYDPNDKNEPLYHVTDAVDAIDNALVSI